MSMYIVVGGGRVGKRIAERLKDVLIIEKDYERAEKLRTEGFRVINADAGDRKLWNEIDVRGKTVILATDDDETNLEIARILSEYEPKEIVSRIESESNRNIFLNLGVKCVSCGKSIASEILSEIALTKRRYFEITVTSENFEGKRIADVDLGEDCTVIVLIKNGVVVRPSPDLVLSEGDILGILCGKEVQKTKNPFNEILAVIRNPENYDEVFNEARMIADAFNSDLLILHKHEGKLACSLKPDKLEPMTISEASEIIKMLESSIDLIVTDYIGEKVELELKLLKNFPILFARGKKSYENILTIINTENHEQMLNYSIVFANRFGRCLVLFLDAEQLKNASPPVDSPNLEVRITEYNPMIEVVMEVKKSYDLVILSISNSVGNIDREILWKIVTDTESSVLVVG